MRPHRNSLIMRTAMLWAQRSTCDRLHVGAVIHRDGRILVQGYNGAAAGLPHCEHLEWDGYGATPEWANDFVSRMTSIMLPGQKLYTDGKTVTLTGNGAPGCTVTVHAEANAIAFAARHGVALEGTSLGVTHEPCLNCAKLIVNAGIVEVMYTHPYRLHDGVELLESAGITVAQVTLTTSNPV